jgi:hypothetical protein
MVVQEGWREGLAADPSYGPLYAQAHRCCVHTYSNSEACHMQPLLVAAAGFHVVTAVLVYT